MKKISGKIIAVLLTLILAFHPLAVSAVYADDQSSPSAVSADNSGTGSGSVNQADGNNTENSSVSNQNSGDINNNQTTSANTGNNTVTSDVTPGNTSGTDSTQNNATPSGSEGSTVTDPATPDGSLIINESGMATFSGAASESAVAINNNTGPDSTNSATATVTDKGTVENNNNSLVSNTATGAAVSGGNTGSGPGTLINSGSAAASANIINILNTNLLGANFWELIANILTPKIGDLDLTYLETLPGFSDPVFLSSLAVNRDTGSGSANISAADLISALSVYSTNSALLTNNISVSADTGRNTATGSGAVVHTGSASAAVNLFNMANTNLYGTNWFYGVINLFGGLKGNILLPYELQFLNSSATGSGGTSVLAANTDTGTGSANFAAAGDQQLLSVFSQNNSVITNNISVSANTGSNTATGSGAAIDTGRANAVSSVFNLANTNITGGNWFFLLVNNFGDWRGSFENWWGNILTVGKSSLLWWQGTPESVNGASQSVTGHNSNTGQGSENTADGNLNSDLSINNQNDARINNNVGVSANTGNNSVKGDGGEIRTGDASAEASAVNIVNTNISGDNWFFGVINIFGSFFGDVIFPRPDLSVTKTADTAEITPGGTVNYTISFANSGNFTSRSTSIVDTLPAGEILISVTGNPEVSGSTLTWDLGDVSPGSSGYFMVKAAVGSGISNNTVITNKATISTATDEPDKDNNTSSVSVTVKTPGGIGESVQNLSLGDSGICTDKIPGGAPILLSAIPGNNSVTLSWTKAAGPDTYYLIAYGTEPGKYIYGNPKVGGSETTSFTVDHLSGGTNYYFVVRAGNGCMPGPFSGELSAFPGGEVLGGPAAGFTPGVLGAATLESTPGGSFEATLGATGSTAQDYSVNGAVCGSCIWWPELFAEFILTGIIYLLFRKKLSRKWAILLIMASALSTYLIFIFLNRSCGWDYRLFLRSSSFFCRYFPVLDLAVAVFFAFLTGRFAGKNHLG